MRSRRPAPAPLALLLVLALTAVVAAGCGAGGDGASSAESSTATKTTEATTSAPRQPGARHAEGAEAGGPTAGGGAPAPAVAPLKVSGGGAARFKVRGGDNSVQEYGDEAGEAELREAAEAVHDFYIARVRGEWGHGCSLLSARTAKGLEGLATDASGPPGSGCPAALAVLTEGITPSLAHRLTAVDAASLRTEGESAFLLYTGPPGRTVYSMPLVEEGGAWRLGAVEGAILPGTTGSSAAGG